MKQADIDNWFSYHAPNPTRIDKYKQLRDKAKEVAVLFDSLVPDCADKTAAMRDLRGTLMAMNLTIACNPETQEPQ